MIPLQYFGMMIVLWPVVLYLVSWMSGWRDLGDVYEDRGEFRGERYYMRTASLNHAIEYSNCLSFSADDEGLRLRVLLPFRFGHPPLFFPWQEVSVASKRAWFSSRCVFSFERAVGVKLCVADALAEQLLLCGRGKYAATLE